MSGADRGLTGGPISRRRLLETGGLAAAFGALLVACGDRSGDEAPGRVGYAPPVTPLPQPEINDIVYLRTATSIEYLVLDLYAWMIDSGQLAEADQELVDRLVADHQAAADTTADLTTQAGGQPYECANVWYTERVVPPMKVAIVGDEADLPESDDPGTDMMRMSYGFETMVSSMYQKMIEQVSDRALRVDLGPLGTLAGRHSAAVAIAVTGAPDGYISPVVLGGELTPDESGRAELFAIPARYGSLASTEIVIGAPNESGTRASYALEIPAENSYVYDGLTCPS